MKTDKLAPLDQLKGTLVVLVWLALALVLRGPDRANGVPPLEGASAAHAPVETTSQTQAGAR